MGSKTLLQQNPPVLNWGCRLTQDVLYNGRKMVVVVVVVVVVVMVVVVVTVESQGEKNFESQSASGEVIRKSTTVAHFLTHSCEWYGFSHHPVHFCDTVIPVRLRFVTAPLRTPSSNSSRLS